MTLAAVADLGQLYRGEPPENLKAYAQRPEEPLPVEQGLAEMQFGGNGVSGFARALASKSAAAVARTAPALGMGVGLGALGASAPVAAGLPLGVTEEGGFDPIGAAIAAGLPGVARYGEELVAAGLQKFPASRVVIDLIGKDPVRLKGRVNPASTTTRPDATSASMVATSSFNKQWCS